jgi:DNA-binding response OmpR family regulator/signal transduction histidine kinase
VCADLQNQVSRFIKVEQNLVTARDLLDRELARLKAIQSYSVRALRVTEVEAFAVLTVESVVEAFELEVSLFLRAQADRPALQVMSAFGFQENPSHLHLELPAERMSAQESCIVAKQDPLLRAWAALDLVEAIICPFSDNAGVLHGLLLGGRTRANEAFYSPIKDELRSAFTIMAHESGALLQALESKQIIQRQIVELQELDRLKDQFLANTSHELRTPLNGIIGLAEAVADGADGDVSELQARHLGMVVASGKRLLGLVNSLLDFAKHSAAGGATIPPVVAKVHLRAYLEEEAAIALQLHFEDAPSRDGCVGTRVASAPRSGRAPVAIYHEVLDSLPTVVVDRTRLSHVFTNLIGNALKFTTDGEIRIAARVMDGDFVRVSVSDTGIGIPAHELNNVFREFYQVDGGLNRAFAGTGLGLAIAKQAVEQHGGQIGVESTVGKGSEFWFTLPRHAALLPQAQESEPGPVSAPKPVFLDSPQRSRRVTQPIRPPAAALVARHARIMIVDDESANLEVLSLKLQGRYEVVATSSGQEALDEIARGEVPDLILADIMMPGLSGYDLCARLRADERTLDVPLIFLTAKTNNEDLVYGLSLGADDYLSKPIDSDQLVARIDGLLAKRARRPGRVGADVVGVAAGQRFEAPRNAEDVIFSTRGERILIVDDEPVDLEVLGTRLTGKGYRVERAESARDALRLIEREQPDLIISDIMMPEMSGYELCKLVRSNPKTRMIPLIFLTAKVQQEDLLFGLSIGADDYLTKPFPTEELFARVRTLLRVAALQRDSLEKERMAAELQLAHTVQAMFMPSDLLADGSARVLGWRRVASETGGDLYGAMRVGDEIFCYMGDVMGHGAHTALLTSYVAAHMRAVARGADGIDPAGVLSGLNTHLHDLTDGRYSMTMFVGRCPTVAGTLRYANAAHCPPVLASVGEIRALRGKPAEPLGATARFEYEGLEEPIQAGDVLVMFTDGVVEASDSRERQFGFGGVSRVLRRVSARDPKTVLDGLVSALDAFQGGTRAEDDQAVLVLQV